MNEEIKNLPQKSKQKIQQESDFLAHNYHPLPVVIEKGKGIFLWDVDGKKYFDFISAYSAVNQGHCHDELIKVMIDQAQKVTLTSRALYADNLGDYAQFMSDTFGYENLIPMNTGVEAVETAIKMARKWAYTNKKIEKNKAKIIFATENFHGRTIGVISASDDDVARDGFSPFVDGILKTEYNNIDSLIKIIEENASDIAAFIVEPIQGEAGIKITTDDYLKKAYELCKKNNILFIADEVQTGIGRTGKLLAINHYDIRPDIVILGKALSGGFMPISAVLADKKITDVMTPGTHGSTFGGNPLANALAIRAVKLLFEEKMIENAEKMGQLFRDSLKKELSDFKEIKEIRGIGLLNAIEIDPSQSKFTAWQICLELKENGLLAKPTHDNIIRLSPPLIITESQIKESINIIVQTFRKYAN